MIVPAQPLTVVQWVTVRLHDDGSVSTSGTIADKRMSLHLLDIARDAIKKQVPDYKAIIVPGSEVEIMPSLPVKALGDMPAHQRGDA